MTPNGGSWQLTVPAGYTGPTAGTGDLAAVSAVVGEYGIAYGALAGYVKPTNQTQLVIANVTSLFEGVYLLIDTNIAPPVVTATEGVYTNKVRVAWQSVPDVTGYEIWKSASNDVNTAELLVAVPDYGAATFYHDDYAVVPLRPYFYWGLAKKGTQSSPMSIVAMGYASLTPEPETPTADITASDMVFLPVNTTNLSTAGTVSFWLGNRGPAALNSSAVAFDFRIANNDAGMVMPGTDQRAFTLAAGQEELVILTAAAKRGLVVPPILLGVKQVQVTVRHASTLVDPNLANNTTTAAGMVLVRPSGVNSPGRSITDYDGDGKSDLFMVHTGWDRLIFLLSGQRYNSIGMFETMLGAGQHQSAFGDYDGGGKTDPMVYYSPLGGEPGRWQGRLSSQGYILVDCEFGGAGFDYVGE